MKKLLRSTNALSCIWRSKKLMILFLLALFVVHPSMAQQQNSILKKEISVHFTEKPLREVLDEIQKMTGVIFLYSSEKLNVQDKVTIDLDKLELGKVLSTLFAGKNLIFEVEDDYIVIKPKPVYTSTNPKEILIKGNIIDELGDPLPGTAVMVKKSQLGTISDGNGYYTIQTAGSDSIILVFSFVGMKTQEVVFNGQVPFNIRMQPEINFIEDIVVTGYQELEKQRVAGSVAKISHEDMDLNVINSIEQSLQGKLPGVTITNVSGQVGRRQTTRVRGTSTFLGNQEPIWVVDGIIQEDPIPFSAQTFDSNGGVTEDNFDYIRNYVGNSISWLNPNDIDDITVLKDASATAIYGVRAANGVIVIRTKEGKEGPLSVSYSMGLNIAEQVTYDKLELMNSKERVAVSREIFERGLVASQTNNNIGYAGALNQYLDKAITYDEFNQQVADMESVNTDWFNILFRNPFSQSHHISLSGGTQKVRVYSSIGYTNQNGTAIGNDQSSYNASIGLNTQINSKLRVSFKLTGNKSKTNGFFDLDPYEYATSVNRVIPAYDDNGDLYYYADKTTGYKYNYINERNESGNTNTVQSINSNLSIQYDILNDLKVNVLGSYNTSSTKGYSYATERTNYITNIRGYEYGTVTADDDLYAASHLPIGGVYISDDNKSDSWNFRTTLTYNKIFNQKHYFTALAGFESQSVKYDGYSSRVYGYLHNRGKSFAKVPVTVTSYGYESENSLYVDSSLASPFAYSITDELTNAIGYYLTLNYSYNNRYVVNFSVRGDASNRFGQYPNEKFNPVWAGGFRWNVSNEDWMQNVSWVTALSLRSTFGYQRNMATEYSPSLIVQIPTSSASTVYDSNTGDYLLNISNLPYEDLRWEQTTSYDVGFDMSLFQNKIYFSGDYYYKKGEDMITSLSVPAEYGIDNMPVNGGSLINKGYELMLGFSPVRNRNFNWSVSVNTSKNYNEVSEVGTQNNSWLTAAQGNLLKKGYAVSSFWAFKCDGIDPETGYPIIDLSVEEGSSPDEDPTAYMTYVGKLDPDFTGGLTNTIRYKQVSLNASLYLQLGGKKFLSEAYPSVIMPTEYENLSSELNDRWTPTNTDAKFPGLPDQEIASSSEVLPGETNTNVNIYEMYNYSTARVVDATCLRLNSLSLSYNFSNSLCEKLSCQSLNIGCTATNLFSIVSKDFHGRDPEVATGNQPRTRSYSFNLNITF